MKNANGVLSVRAEGTSGAVRISRVSSGIGAANGGTRMSFKGPFKCYDPSKVFKLNVCADAADHLRVRTPEFPLV